MRRREFLGALGGALTASPLTVRAQQAERVRRIGVLLVTVADDAEYQARIGAFQQALALLGWTIGRNLRIDTRWATTNVIDIRRQAAELVALAPDVVLAHGSGPVGALLQLSRTVPIVFPILGDPVGAGFVDSLARPGGNVTGFMNFEYSMGGKWLELLKQIAPNMTRAAVLRDPADRLWHQPVCCNSGCGAVTQMEVSPLTCAMLAKSNATSRRSRALRMAA